LGGIFFNRNFNIPLVTRVPPPAQKQGKERQAQEYADPSPSDEQREAAGSGICTEDGGCALCDAAYALPSKQQQRSGGTQKELRRCGRKAQQAA